MNNLNKKLDQIESAFEEKPPAAVWNKISAAMEKKAPIKKKYKFRALFLYSGVTGIAPSCLLALYLATLGPFPAKKQSNVAIAESRPQKTLNEVSDLDPAVKIAAVATVELDENLVKPVKTEKKENSLKSNFQQESSTRTVATLAPNKKESLASVQTNDNEVKFNPVSVASEKASIETPIELDALAPKEILVESEIKRAIPVKTRTQVSNSTKKIRSQSKSTGKFQLKDVDFAGEAMAYLSGKVEKLTSDFQIKNPRAIKELEIRF